MNKTTSGTWFILMSGATGAQGATGPQGSSGTQGSAGPTGPQGLTGPQGATGPQGLTGANGVQGATGPQGTTGNVGATGATGAAGAVGAAGAAGAAGQAGPAGPNGPSVTIFYDECNFTAGGALTVSNSGSYYANVQMYQAGAFSTATGIFSYAFTLASGTYYLRVYGTKGSNAGQYTFSFNGGSGTTVDFYSAGLTPGIYTVGSFVIGASGSQTMNVVCSGKNVLSTNYGGFFYKFSLTTY